MPQTLFHRRHWRRRLYAVQELVAGPRAVLKRHPDLAPRLVMTAAVVVLTGLALAQHPIVPQAKPVPPVTVSTDKPSEAPVTRDTYMSKATGTEPKFVRLPSIKAEGFVEKVGIDQHKQIAVPTNIHLAGWFAATAIPGELGLSIIDGHLDGSRKPGIFANLAKLKTGDQLSVELANGAVRNFQVKAVQTMATAQAAAVLFSQTPGVSRQLNLITCGGNFSRSTGYDQRGVVSAGLMK